MFIKSTFHFGCMLWIISQIYFIQTYEQPIYLLMMQGVIIAKEYKEWPVIILQLFFHRILVKP